MKLMCDETAVKDHCNSYKDFSKGQTKYQNLSKTF